MTTDATCTAALDTSTAHASLVVADGVGRHRVTSHQTAIGRRSAGLMPSLLDSLAAVGIELGQIGRWTVGMGPGSFTGIRLGAALVKGICAGTGALYRGIPGSLAMVQAGAPADATEAAVLHDGRRHEVIVSRYRRSEQGWQEQAPAVALAIDLLVEQLPPTLPCIILAGDGARELLPPAIQARLQVLPFFDARWLLDVQAPWPRNLVAAEASMEPVYVRPAVFVPPLPPTSNPQVKRLLDRLETTHT